MHATIILGNTSPLEAFKPDPTKNDTETQKMELPDGASGTETTVNIEEPNFASALRTIDDLWQYHGDDLPEWVEGDHELLVAALSEHFSRDGHECGVGRPKGWKSAAAQPVIPTKAERKAAIPGGTTHKTAATRVDLECSRLDVLKAAFEAEWGHLNRRLVDSGVPLALRTNAGADLQADAMGSQVATDTGTSTAVAATTLTDSGKAWTVNGHTGRMVTSGSRYAVILSNTATVLTLSRWVDPATPGGAAGSTPATGVYVIVPGNAPASWLGLTENVTTPALGDTTLTAELAAGGGGLVRALATYAHTAGAASYTLTKTFTVNGSDSPPKTPGKIGVFGAAVGGRMAFTTLLTSPPALQSGDQLTITETVTL